MAGSDELEWLFNISELEQRERNLSVIRQTNHVVDCFELQEKQFTKRYRE